MVESYKIYLKDTGFVYPSETGNQESWKLNDGLPIPLWVNNLSLNSKSNVDVGKIYKGSYYYPHLISRELPQLTLNVTIKKDEIVQSQVKIYNVSSNSFETINNPPLASTLALFEQMKLKDSHFDLYASDDSGLTPSEFKNEPLYWLAYISNNNSTSTTPETHLNVKLIGYSLTKKSISAYTYVLNFIVLL